MARLINNIAEFKTNFATIDANFTFPTIQQSVDDVERDIIGAAIGPDALAWFQNNLNTQDPVQQSALIYLQRSVAALAILDWSQTSMFRMTDKALSIAKTNDGVIPSDKKVTDFRASCDEKGNNFLDKALELMEKNLAKFPAYADSGVRQDQNQLLIKTAADFTRYRSINGSRLTFLSLTGIIRDVQEEYLPGYMTPAYYEIFIGRALSDQLTNAERNGLLPKVKKAVAYLTIAQACKDLPVRVKGNGLFVNKYINSVDYAMQDAAGQAQIDFLEDDCREKADRYLKEISDYLNANAAGYPDYVVPVQAQYNVNCEDSGFYFL